MDTGDPNKWGEFLKSKIENRKLPFPSPSANLVGVGGVQEEMLILLSAILWRSLRITISKFTNLLVINSGSILQNLAALFNNHRHAALLIDEYYCETPILKAQRIGIGKLNNPALAEGIIPRARSR